RDRASEACGKGILKGSGTDWPTVVAKDHATSRPGERFPRSLPTGGLVLLRHRSGGIAGHRNRGSAPRFTAFLATFIRVGFPDHGWRFPDGQTIRPGEHHQGTNQTGREWASFS